MKMQFKLFIIALIMLQLVNAQGFAKIEMDEKHTIYKESFSTNANTILVLDLSNTSTQIYKSEDDKVHIEYTIEFKNYRKKTIRSFLNNIVVSGKKENNKITYSTKGRNTFYNRPNELEDFLTLMGELGKNINDSIQDKKNKRKSLDSLITEINESDFKFGRNRSSNTRQKKWRKNVKLMISRMVIKIPENVHLRGVFERSQLVFTDDISNQMTINSRNSKLKFKTLNNPLNVFDVDNGNFKAEQITGGDYNFANTRAVKIGAVEKTKISSEFTKIELGEIQQGVTVIDFNSELWFYNWADNFKNFDLKSEYSQIHFFYPKLDHSLKVFGNNTKNLVGEDAFEINMQPTNKAKKYLMMERKAQGNTEYSGHIYFDIVHGIIYSHDDSIVFINKED